jgi:hypothetical protein
MKAIDQDFRLIAEQYGTENLILWCEEIDTQVEKTFVAKDPFLRLSLRRFQRIIRTIIIERTES